MFARATDEGYRKLNEDELEFFMDQPGVRNMLEFWRDNCRGTLQ